MLSGTLKERADAPPALRAQLDDLAQLRPRDAQGACPWISNSPFDECDTRSRICRTMRLS